MRQVLQNLKSGETTVADVPCPRMGAGQVLIRTRASLVSAGTERMLVEFSRAGFLEKARQQPDKVRMVLDKIKTDGLVPTIEAVRDKLDQPMPMGYSNVGMVLEVGAGASGFAVGERVVSNGKHAEVVSVPVNLCARVPEGVSDEEAAFTVIGAIALQGIRLAQPTLGEAFVVTGLGLIGLMAVQLLRAHGCRVLGLDFDRERLELARKFGADTVDLSGHTTPALRATPPSQEGSGGGVDYGADWESAAQQFSRGRGVDAVIVTAATKSSEPMHQAALMCRQRGRIVLVGVTGLELSRADFYEKELSFQVSCSYGPGRYDPQYEEKGHDYPVGFVRWTEQRNFEAVLDMLADGRLDMKPLISHRFALERAEEAYALVAGGGPSLGILLQYASPAERRDAKLLEKAVLLGSPGDRASAGPGTTPALRAPPPWQEGNRVRAVTVAFVGSGNYATGVLIPAFKAAGARLKTVASSGGVSGVHAGRKHGFEQTTTAAEAVFADAEIDAVVIATRHDSHARLVCEVLRAGKHVFVEKPLALTMEELAEIRAAYESIGAVTPHHPVAFGTTPPTLRAGGELVLMVGFNRRFAPHVGRIAELLAGVKEPKAFVMTVNAGAIPAEHWTQDADVGGGRIVGEACHFIDLLRFLAGAAIVSSEVAVLGSSSGARAREDRATITLRFADGSLGTIHYLANGHKAFPKERLDVFCGGRILQLDNFRKLTGWGWPGFSSMRLWRQDKGQRACAAAFLAAVGRHHPGAARHPSLAGGESLAPIPFEELIEVSRVAIEAAEKARCR